MKTFSILIFSARPVGADGVEYQNGAVRYSTFKKGV